MSGGSSMSSMNANGQVAFNPTSIGGGNIAVGGPVYLSNLDYGYPRSSSNMPMPMPMQNMQLQNLKETKNSTNPNKKPNPNCDWWWGGCVGP